LSLWLFWWVRLFLPTPRFVTTTVITTVGSSAIEVVGYQRNARPFGSGVSLFDVLLA
jgi:hypothetical protein